MLTVDKTRVAKKLKLDPTEHEGNIDALIAEMLPLISLKIETEYLETADANIQSILNLGATEIVTGEYLKEMANSEEDSDSFTAGIVKVGENKAVQNRGKRANEWIESGWSKLKDYLKPTDYFYFGAG